MAARVGRIVFTRPATAGAYGIEVVQHGRDNFSIQYGQQVKSGMTLAEASSELGGCIFHAVSCEGGLDNG
jgi:hypothetical protein